MLNYAMTVELEEIPREATNEPRTHILVQIDKGLNLTGTRPLPVDARIFRKNRLDNPKQASVPECDETVPPEKTLPPAKPWAR